MGVKREAVSHSRKLWFAGIKAGVPAEPEILALAAPFGRKGIAARPTGDPHWPAAAAILADDKSFTSVALNPPEDGARWKGASGEEFKGSTK